MKTQDQSIGWPCSVECDSDGRLWVEESSGERTELDRFKQDAQDRAVALRAQAVDHAYQWVGDMLHRCGRRGAQLVRALLDRSEWIGVRH